MITSDQLISTYLEAGSLPNLPRDHFVGGALVAADSENRMESLDAGTGMAFAAFAAGTAVDEDRAGRELLLYRSAGFGAGGAQCVWRAGGEPSFSMPLASTFANSS